MLHTVKRPDGIPEERPAEITYYDADADGLKKARSVIRYLIGTADTVKYPPVKNQKMKQGKLKRKGQLFAYEMMTVDTETTTLQNMHGIEGVYAFPYLYQLRFGGINFLARDDLQFIALIAAVEEELAAANINMVCYIHNASFEWAFFKTLLDIDAETVFALKSRRIGYFQTKRGMIIFRCSYILSNMTLEKFAENYCDSSMRKDKELIDYEIARYPWTPLEESTLYYSLMDVIVLEAAILSIMRMEGDNLKTVPMTNTGYVRRDARKACLGENTKKHDMQDPAKREEYFKCARYRKGFVKMKLDYDQYGLLREAFRGGNTHANRFYAGRILEDVGHADFASSYPAQLVCSAEFPMGRLMDCTGSLKTISDIDYYAANYWMLIKIVITDFRLKDPGKVLCPYIPIGKNSTQRTQLDGGTFDNGRIIACDGALSYTFLGVEWWIVRKQLAGSKFKVMQAYYTPKGYLPDNLRRACLEYYRKKTALKGIADMLYEYNKSKNRLNSYYGMMVEQIIKAVITCDPDTLEINEKEPTRDQALEQLDEFYHPRNRKFLAYQWGVTITALARSEHMRLIEIVGDDFIYGDTDSIFYRNPDKHRADIEEYNRQWLRYADGCGMDYTAVTRKGDVQRLGVADIEPENIRRFVTLGAKKYAYEDAHGELFITVAGVPKAEGARILGRLENFKPGFTFYVPDSGTVEERQHWKKTLHYRDDLNLDLDIDGHRLHVGSCIGLTRAPYVLDLTEAYTQLTGYTDRYEQDPEIW